MNALSSSGERSLLPTSSGRRQVIATGTKVHPDGISPSVAAMENEAKAKGHQVLADLGNQAASIFFQIDERLNRAEDAATLSQFKSQLKVGLNSIGNQFGQQDPSVADYSKKAEKAFGTFATKLAKGYSKDARSGLKAGISGEINKALADNSIKFQNATIKRRKDQAVARSVDIVDAYKKAGVTADTEEVEIIKADISKLLRGLSANGVIPAPTAAKQIHAARREIDEGRARWSASNEDFHVFKDRLRSGEFREGDYLFLQRQEKYSIDLKDKLERRAVRLKEKDQKRSLQIVYGKIDKGLFTESDIAKEGALGNISPAGVNAANARLNKFLTDGGRPDNSKEVGRIRQDMFEHPDKYNNQTLNAIYVNGEINHKELRSLEKDLDSLDLFKAREYRPGLNAIRRAFGFDSRGMAFEKRYTQDENVHRFGQAMAEFNNLIAGRAVTPDKILDLSVDMIAKWKVISGARLKVAPMTKDEAVARYRERHGKDPATLEQERQQDFENARKSGQRSGWKARQDAFRKIGVK